MGRGFGRMGRFDPDMPKAEISKELLVRIGAYFKPYWKYIMFTLIALVASALLENIPTLLTKEIVDVALPEGDMSLLGRLTLLSFTSVIVIGLLSVLERYLSTIVSKNIVRSMRNTMYEHLQGMSMRFFSNTKTGEVISRLNNDINGVENIFSNTIIRIVSNFLTILFVAILMVSMNWKLSLLALFIVPMFVSPTRKVGQSRWQIASKTHEKMADLNNVIQETLNVNGALLVKVSTKEKDEYERFASLNDDITKLQVRESLVGRWFGMVVRVFTQLGPTLIYFYGGYLVIQGELTVGEIIAFVSFVSRLYRPVADFSNLHIDLTRSMALFERIFAYFDMPQEITDAPAAIEMPKIKGNIEFDRLDFAYNVDQPTLRNISFSIEQGQMAALVGLSGAGKTTVTNLLARLYDPNGGSIRIDGHDIRDVTQESLRRQIGMVTQDTYVFNTSVKDNLLYSKATASDGEIEDACKIANIHDFVMTLPEGYDTIVGERGTKLSGGEKQRLSIARAILKDPRIIIMDEATSSLDSLSEVLIQNAIKPLLEGRTSIVIAHRLSTIMAADLILVMDQGEVVERGTHEELVAQGGLYSELYEKQFKRKAVS